MKAINKFWFIELGKSIFEKMSITRRAEDKHVRINSYDEYR